MEKIEGIYDLCRRIPECMKIAVPFLVLFLAASSVMAQSPLLDGRRFTIEMYVGKEKDAVDTLIFENSMMNYATAKKYGFVPDLYKAKEKNGAVSFTATFESKKNGKMIWEGKVQDEYIEGTLIWARPLENAVNYTFKTKPEIK